MERVRAEPLSNVSAGARDESVIRSWRTSTRYLRLRSFSSADSPPKTPLEPLRRRESYGLTRYESFISSSRKPSVVLGSLSCLQFLKTYCGRI